MARRALLVLVASLASVLLFFLLLAAGDRLGWLPDVGPPPHFRPLADPAGLPLRDARGRELLALDEGVGALVGKPRSDRLWLTREKDAGVLRVLSIGESTTFGAGYHGEASYSRYLEARLRRLLDRDVEVVNCGKNGSDSHDWPTLAGELGGLAPDLLVIYVGHNELKKPNLLDVLEPANARLRRCKTLRRLLGPPKDDFVPPPAVGEGRFLNDEQRAFALELFDAGVRALLESGRGLRVPVVLCIPSSNVLDTRPRYSVLQPGPDAATRREEALAAGGPFAEGELPDLGAPDADPAARASAEQELARVERALERDPAAAILHFRRGRLLVALRRVDEARAALARSLELDDLPERASPDLIARLRELAQEHGARVADVESRFTRESRRGAPGYDLFIDYCHPNLWGHYLIADEIVRALAGGGVLGLDAALAAGREPGASDRERFEAYGRELGISEEGAARHLLDRAKLEIGNLGTRFGVSPREWRIPEEFLKAVEQQDPALAGGSAEYHVFRGTCRAALGDREGTRRFLAAAERIDRAATAALAVRMRQLPALVQAFLHVDVRLDASGFRWDGK